MLKKFLKFLKKFFSAKFIHPIVDEKTNTAVDDKINAWRKQYDKLTQENEVVLRNLIRTYFDKAYESDAEMEVAYGVCNKTWCRHVRLINSTSKIISLDKMSFENGAKEFIKRIKAKEVTNG